MSRCYPDRLRGRVEVLFVALTVAATVSVRSAGADEFVDLKKEIISSPDWDNTRLKREAMRDESLILAGDKTPIDIVWRRTSALLANIRAMKNAPDLSAESAALAALKQDVENLHKENSQSENVQLELFAKITALRRKIAFKNPLLDFNRIVFLKHNKQVRGDIHMIDQFLGFNAEKKGGVYVLENAFSDNPVLKSLLKDSQVESGRLKGKCLEDNGSFISLELDYDGKTILFGFTEAEHNPPDKPDYSTQIYTEAEMVRMKKSGYYYRPESTYHVFKAGVDGAGLLQLTDGKWNEFDPVFLPSGRIVFISERSGGACRCGTRPLPSATLFAMMPDGSDIIQLSWHDTNEWQPSVDNNGMIVYTRWDYVDRDSDIAHHIWHCFPDGRDPRSLHGNYPEVRESRPWMEMSVRAVPGSAKYVAVTAQHHGQAYGSLVLIDLREKDDRSTSQLKRITPETPFAESESLPGLADEAGGKKRRKKDISPVPGERYGTPWPLSEDYYLCVYDSSCRNYGIYLVDSFGNRELIYNDPSIACLDPIPLKPRKRPPAVPVKTTQAKVDLADGGVDQAMGKVAIMNIYESELEWPGKTRIKELRVVNIFPKDNPIMNDPNVGKAAQSLCRGVLGTVPVEDDGSVFFEVPTGAGIYFQALDENGMSVQTMRSDTYVHPGETLTCVGCHESKHNIMDNRERTLPLALKRAPSKLKPEAEGSYPLTFSRLVQPVLDKHCVSCHNQKKSRPNMRGDEFATNGWSRAFVSLQKFAWGMSGGNGIIFKEGRQYSVPGQDGARVSKLYEMLKRGHGDVKLAPEEMRRITLWLDCNSNFYGAYHDVEKQARGGIVKPKAGVPDWTDFERLVR